jgi:hypothetical protein
MNISKTFLFFHYIYITPVNNLPLGARKPQRFTNIYNEQYNQINKYWSPFLKVNQVDDGSPASSAVSISLVVLFI